MMPFPFATLAILPRKPGAAKEGLAGAASGRPRNPWETFGYLRYALGAETTPQGTGMHKKKRKGGKKEGDDKRLKGRPVVPFDLWFGAAETNRSGFHVSLPVANRDMEMSRRAARRRLLLENLEIVLIGPFFQQGPPLSQGADSQPDQGHENGRNEASRHRRSFPPDAKNSPYLNRTSSPWPAESAKSGHRASQTDAVALDSLLYPLFRLANGDTQWW